MLYTSRKREVLAESAVTSDTGPSDVAHRFSIIPVLAITYSLTPKIARAGLLSATILRSSSTDSRRTENANSIGTSPSDRRPCTRKTGSVSNACIGGEIHTRHQQARQEKLVE